MNLDEALQTFILESRELLESMEEALLKLEQSADEESVNAIFRAAHTIKGSAGLFGLDHIVAFTHVAESVLDKVRSGQIGIDSDLVALFLSVSDHLNTLIDSVANDTTLDDDTRAAEAELLVQLEALMGDERGTSSVIPQMPETGHTIKEDNGQSVTSDNWHISLRFGEDVMRNGMDPTSFLRYLTTFGDILSIITMTDRVPALEDMQPESNYLGFEMSFHSGADKETIEGAFEFVWNDSDIRILPPHSKVSEFLDIINKMPPEPMKLGEMLVQCGTLTAHELEVILAMQEKHPSTKKIGEILVEQQVVEPEVVEAALVKQKQQTKESKQPVEASMIRVDAAKLDQLINLVGELIIAGAGTQLAAQKSKAMDLLESTLILSRLVEQVRDSALNLRMIAIGGTFNRFNRVVRDVGQELGKDIRLQIYGEDTELDKTVVEKIGDPLTHLVRNSMDHGIEAEEVRIANGKPAFGTVILNAFHDAGFIVIEVSDDGGGLNKQRIVNKAIAKGLIPENHTLTDKEIFNLIFEPGFSTAEQLSNLSGRGVGMDVVKRNITALRGTIDLASEEGKGTTTRIRLPLTLAIIDGFMIGIGKSTFVVPLESVVECIELNQVSLDNNGDHDYLNLRGEVLPFIRLREMFEVEEEPVRRENVVVVQFAGQRAGLVVDHLMGEFQTVIKPLGKVFSHTRGIGGFTILGTGAVALILDIPGLLAQVLQKQNAQKPAVAFITNKPSV
ncbi:chemotaxis protein CheA [Leeia sp. TBRC 13508]|uniref:Chemotaxis protein CheA n=1 Tax=Leeia speluncae TaxID=2884804 RepID=A0ABS8D6Z1_9NEIS|nr:chemotaxis protein CheA [Leeia speluncae]MCB6183961.1 chemotaxis protein CheA [Leeia speluncae]